MSPKHCKRDQQPFSILSPWETEPEESCINKYCSDCIEPILLSKQAPNLPKIQQKRAASTCIPAKKTQYIPFYQRTSSSKPNIHTLNQFSQKNFNTISQNRSERVQRKKVDRGNVLQELSVKNFIIEGGQETTNIYKEKVLKKRESTYILKQKFSEFRRSLKLMGQNKQNSNFRVIRYES